MADTPNTPHIFGLRELLIEHEGYEDKMYPDSNGIPTIGVGANMKIDLDPAEKAYFKQAYGAEDYPKRAGVQLSSDDIEFLFSHRQTVAENAARRYMGDEWSKLSPARQAALADVAYNQGSGGLHKFVNLRSAISKAIKTGDWTEAATHINDPSVPLNRRPTVTNLMLTGQYPGEAATATLENELKVRGLKVPDVDPMDLSLNRSDYEMLGRQLQALRGKKQRTAEEDNQMLKMAWTMSALDKKFKTESALGLLDPANDELLTQSPTLRTKGKAAAARLAQNPGPEIRFMFETLGTAAYKRLESFADFFARPFLSEQQQQDLQFSKDRQNAELQMIQDATARELGIPRPVTESMRTVGKYTPDVALGLGSGLPGTTARRIGAGALQGAGFAGADVPLNEDPSIMAGAGGLFGGAVTGVFEIPSAGAKFLGRRAVRAEKTGVTASSKAESRAAGVDLSLGEASGDQLVKEMEGAIPIRPGNGPRWEFMRQRREQVMNLFFDFEKKLNPANLSTETIVNQTETVYRSTLKRMQKDAGDRFRAELIPAARELGATITEGGRITGGRGFVRPDKLMADISEQMQAAAEAGNTKLFARLERELKEVAAAAGDEGFTLGAVQKRLSDLSADANPTGRISTDLSTAAERVDSVSMLRALEADLDEAAKTLPDGPAAEALARARLVYREDKELIQSFKNTAIDNLLGKAVGVEESTFLQKLTKLPEGQFTKLMGIVDQQRPELGQNLRGAWFKELLERSQKTGGEIANESGLRFEVDYGSLVRELDATGPARLAVLLDVPAAEASRMTAGINVLSRIAKQGQEKRGTAPGITTEIVDIVRNAISLNPIFLVGLVGRLGAPDVIERMLFTKEGQAALSTIGRPGVKAGAVKTAVNVLGRTIVAADEEARLEAQKQALLEEEAASGARAYLKQQRAQQQGAPGRML